MTSKNNFHSQYETDFTKLVETEIQRALLMEIPDDKFIMLYRKYLNHANTNNEFICWILHKLHGGIHHLYIDTLINIIDRTISHLIKCDNQDDIYTQACLTFISPLFFEVVIHPFVKVNEITKMIERIYGYANVHHWQVIIDSLNNLQIKNDHFMDKKDKILTFCKSLTKVELK